MAKQHMFRAKIYPKYENKTIYTDNVRASVTSSMSVINNMLPNQSTDDQ